MKFYGILNSDGEIIEKGFCDDNCGIITALGYYPEAGARYVAGKGATEEDAVEAARDCFPITIS